MLPIRFICVLCIGMALRVVLPQLEAVERRRQMTEEERREDDKELDKMQPKREIRHKYHFMQKYYHRVICGEAHGSLWAVTGPDKAQLHLNAAFRTCRLGFGLLKSLHLQH